MLPSLIDTDRAQPDLPLAGGSFLNQDVAQLAEGAIEKHASGEHTAARLFETNPQLYKAIMWLYASGSAGQLKIADVLSVSVHTVRAVIHREKLARGAAMDTQKTLVSLSDLREMTLETLIEKLANPMERKAIPFDKLMIGLGIQTEKIELLRGNATERIEHVDSHPAATDFQNWLQNGSIDTTASETGLPGGDCGQRADGGAGVALAVPAGLLAAELGTAPGAHGSGSGSVDAPGDALHCMDNEVCACGNANEMAGSDGGDVTRDVFEPAKCGAASGADEALGAPESCGAPGAESQGGRGSTSGRPGTGGDE